MIESFDRRPLVQMIQEVACAACSSRIGEPCREDRRTVDPHGLRLRAYRVKIGMVEFRRRHRRQEDQR